MLELITNAESLNCNFPAPAIKASVPSNVKLASPAIAFAPVTVTTVLLVDPVREAVPVPPPISDKTSVPAR